MRFYRWHVRENLPRKLGRPPTDDEIIAAIASAREKGFGEEQLFNAQVDIGHLKNLFRKHNLTKRAKSGAAKRWSK